MVYRVACGARKACGARNTGVPKFKVEVKLNIIMEVLIGHLSDIRQVIVFSLLVTGQVTNKLNKITCH